jgi:hypothetical protein
MPPEPVPTSSIAQGRTGLVQFQQAFDLLRLPSPRRQVLDDVRLARDFSHRCRLR